MPQQHDYLAFILIGAGSAYGRGPDKEAAIKTAIKELRGWRQFYKVDDVDVVVNVIDVNGYDTVIWGYDGVWGVPEGNPEAPKEEVKAPIERVERHTPKWKR